MSEPKGVTLRFTSEQVIEVILSNVAAAGSQKELARSKRISPGYLSDVLCGRREISAQLASKFGFQKEVMFRVLP